MATSVRGRGGSRSRTSSGTYSYYSGRSGMGNKPTYGKKTYETGSTVRVPPAWKHCNTEFSNKISSFKTLVNQTKGPAKRGRPSPTTLNTFANWINKGAQIQTVTNAQVAQWAKTTRRNFSTKSATPTSCKNVLCAKFGKNNIKAVACTKSGSFMVVTPSMVQGKSFCFPK